MPLQSWEIVVFGKAHHVDLDRNPDSGKFLARLDGRIAVKPFSETRCEQPIDIDGRPYILRVDNGHYALEEKISRYVDSSKPREQSNLGAVTIARALEHITLVSDDALLRIEKLSDAVRIGGAAGAGGGILGAVLTETAAAIAQKVVNEVGAPYTIKQQLKSFASLESVATCRFEHLPFDLIALFDDVDLDSRVTIVPRKAVRTLEVSTRKIVATTAGGTEKFDLGAAGVQVLDHLCAARYPLPTDDIARASEAAREERARVPEPALLPLPAPAPAPAAEEPAGRNFSGLPEVRWTSPMLTVIGKDPSLESLMNEDAKAYTSVYPKTTFRRVRAGEPPFRDLGAQRYDIVHLHGVFDDKTRFKEQGGFTISLKDLVTKLVDARVRMLWLASPNDQQAAKATLEWIAGLNIFVAFTTARATDFSSILAGVLAALAEGEPITKSWPRLAAGSASSCLFAGRGEAIFRSK